MYKYTIRSIVCEASCHPVNIKNEVESEKMQNQNEWKCPRIQKLLTRKFCSKLYNVSTYCVPCIYSEIFLQEILSLLSKNEVNRPGTPMNTKLSINDKKTLFKFLRTINTWRENRGSFETLKYIYLFD